jgi:hypothetical protein
VTSPGSGRANPPRSNPRPSEESAAAVADSIDALRDLHADAGTAGILATPTRDGRLLNAVFYARREQLLQELPPPLRSATGRLTAPNQSHCDRAGIDALGMDRH